MKKYALRNSYFKNRSANDPDTIFEIVSFFKENGELPFSYHGDNWVYDAMTERQKRKGVILNQFLTPDIIAERLVEFACMYRPSSGLALDACCGTGQITNRLIKYIFIVEEFDIDNEMVEICKLLFPGNNFYRMDYHEPDHNKKYKLIVSNPPYDTKELQYFLEWLHGVMSSRGKAVLLLPSGFIDKVKPKALTDILSKFKCIYREFKIRKFELTNTSTEIVILELAS